MQEQENLARTFGDLRCLKVCSRILAQIVAGSNVYLLLILAATPKTTGAKGTDAAFAEDVAQPHQALRPDARRLVLSRSF